MVYHRLHAYLLFALLGFLDTSARVEGADTCSSAPVYVYPEDVFTHHIRNVSVTRAIEMDVVLSLSHLVTNLHWQNFVILYDNQRMLSTALSVLLDGQTLTTVSVRELPTQLDESLQHEFLRIHQDRFPSLHFVLLTSYQRALELLRIVEETDTAFKRRTDFRHQSYWIIACLPQSHPHTSALSEITRLENVLLVTSDHKSSQWNPAIYTLHVVPQGRAFVRLHECSFSTTHDSLFPNTKYGLNNRTLLVSVMKYLKLVSRDVNDTKYEGYFIDMLQEMATVLNFSYEIIQPHDMSYGIYINGTWNGLTGQLARRDVDLTVAAMSVNEDREKVMDFLLPPIYTLIEDFVYATEEGNSKWALYMQPVESFVLLVLAVSVLCFTLVLTVLSVWDKYMKEGKRDATTRRFSLNKVGRNTLYTFAILLNRGQTFNPFTLTLRILVFTWGLFSLVMATMYSAKLVSFLAVDKQKLPFQSLKELVRQTHYKWGFQGGDITEHIFQKSRTGDIKTAWEGMQRFLKEDKEVLDTNNSVHIAKMLREKYAFLTDRDSMDKLLSQKCQLRVMGEDIIWHQMSFGVPTDFPLKADLENVLSHMRDAGLFNVWWQKWKATHRSECGSNRATIVLGLSDVQMAFYILLLGLGLAVVAVSMEMLSVVILRCLHRTDKQT